MRGAPTNGLAGTGRRKIDADAFDLAAAACDRVQTASSECVPSSADGVLRHFSTPPMTMNCLARGKRHRRIVEFGVDAAELVPPMLILLAARSSRSRSEQLSKRSRTYRAPAGIDVRRACRVAGDEDDAVVVRNSVKCDVAIAGRRRPVPSRADPPTPAAPSRRDRRR